MQIVKLKHIVALAGVVTAVAALIASATAVAADNASVSGTLIYKHQETVADTDRDPAATNVGQFFHDYPRGAPGRLPMIPTKEVAILKVRKTTGENIEIRQDWKDSRDLNVGDSVMIEQIESGPHVVAAN